jgi:hypothetical protein
MSSKRFTATAIFGLAAVWLFAHRYFGIQHDGLFYAVQALAHNSPEAFERDIFFAFGSQDDYSLFSRIYARLIAWLDLSGAGLAGLVAAQLAWAAAAAAIARHWLAGQRSGSAWRWYSPFPVTMARRQK